MHAIVTSKLSGVEKFWPFFGTPSPGSPLPGRADARIPADATLSGIAPVKALLAAGADPKLADSLGFTALHYAARTDYGVEVATALLDGGAEVNSRDASGLTPLDHALALGLERMPPFLEQRGGKRGRDLP